MINRRRIGWTLLTIGYNEPTTSCSRPDARRAVRATRGLDDGLCADTASTSGQTTKSAELFQELDLPILNYPHRDKILSVVMADGDRRRGRCHQSSLAPALRLITRRTAEAADDGRLSGL